MSMLREGTHEPTGEHDECVDDYIAARRFEAAACLLRHGSVFHATAEEALWVAQALVSRDLIVTPGEDEWVVW